jgi:hypothetical protein
MYETLSRYLAGELGEEEARAVRVRIGADPAWAAAWEVMSSLPDDLAALPQPAPPPALDQAIIDRWAVPAPREVIAGEETDEPVPVAPPPARSRPWLLLVPVALAAAVFGALLVPTSPAQVRVSLGTQHVEGEVHVLAGDTTVDLDGVADVIVEPGDLHARAEDPMNRSHLLSAAAGSVVTVVVMEGVAVVHEGDTPAVTVHAGERRTTGGTAAPTSVAADGGATGDTEARITALEAELQDLRLRYAMVKGQLDGRLGQPLDFPPDLPVGYRPQEFDSRARLVVENVPGTELVRTECEEYPCVAYYKSTSGDAQWTNALGAALSKEWGADAGIFQMGLRVEEGDQVAALAAVAVVPTDDPDVADAVRARLNPRVEPTMNELESEERAKHPAQ